MPLLVLGFFFFLLQFIGSFILGELLRPNPEVNHAKPAGLGDFNFPTAEEGRAIPVIFGRVLLKGPNLIWYGDYKTVPIVKTQKIKKLFSSKTINTVIGHRYFVGMHFALCHSGVEFLYSVRVAEKVAWSGTQALPGSISINAPELFGGIKKEGGIVGTLDLQDGNATQTLNSYLGSQLTDSPAYRGISAFIWRGGEVGTSHFIKPWSFELGRYPSNLGFSPIGDDLNPAEMIWELMLNSTWALGLPSSNLGSASFIAAGTTLESEGMGVSFTWDQRKAVETMVQEVLKHIDGVVFLNFRTGVIDLALARGGTDPSSLPIFDTSNIAELVSFSRTGWDETVNELKVLWTNRAGNYKQASAPVFDLANFDLQGGTSVSTTVQYPGFTTATNANKAAWRDLRSLSFPLAKCSIRVNRKGNKLLPGDLFVFSWSPLEVSLIVMRVLRLRSSELGDGKIIVDATQDVFSLSASAFGDAPASEWTDPVGSPTAFTLEDIRETPYQLLAEDDGSAAEGTIDPDLARILLMGAKPSGSTLDAEIQTRVLPDAFESRGNFIDFTPTGLTRDIYPIDTAYVDESDTLIIDTALDMEFLFDTTDQAIISGVVNMAYLGDEIIAFRDITDLGGGEWSLNGVYRGLLDSVPVEHPAGTRIWFGYEAQVTTQDTYNESNSVDARNIPRTPKGELAEGSASIISHTITRRSLRPYPPGDVKINSVSFPEAMTGDLTVTWVHRDRTAQSGAVKQSDGSIGPEAGVTYTLRIYGELGTLVHTEAGMTGTSYTYPNGTEISESGLGRINDHFRIELEAVRAGFASHQFQEREFDRAGYGLNYGQYYGGI